MTAKLFISILTQGLSMWFSIIAMILPYWWSLQPNKGEISYAGLYKYCTQDKVNLNCTDTISSDHTKWLVSVQVLMTLAVLSSILSIGLISYYIFLYHDNKGKIKVALGAMMFEAIFTLSGIIVFSSKISSTFPGGRLSDSFVSAILSFVIALLSFGFCLLALIKDDFDWNDDI